MDLLEKNITARDILTLETFRNAITLDMALGYSTNSVLHLLAIASEAEVTVDLNIFNEISSVTPQICKLSPAGEHTLAFRRSARLAEGRAVGSIFEQYFDMSGRLVPSHWNQNCVAIPPCGGKEEPYGHRRRLGRGEGPAHLGRPARWPSRLCHYKRNNCLSRP